MSAHCRLFSIGGNSHLDAKRHSFPQNYKTLLIHPKINKGNFSIPEQA
jgi:hypothetical protein